MSSELDEESGVPVAVISESAPSKQLEISNAVVRIYKHYLGRGPRSARTHISDDMAVVVLNGVLTRAERSLFEAGNHELLMSQRAAMQRLMADEMIASVQSILGREVISFMSTNDPEKEIGVELFVLESSRHAPHGLDHAARNSEHDGGGLHRDGAGPDGARSDGAGPDGAGPAYDGGGPDGAGPAYDGGGPDGAAADGSSPGHAA